MELLILLALLIIATVVMVAGIATGNFAASAAAGSFFLFIGLIVLTSGIDYSAGTTSTQWNSVETINGSNVTVTHTNETVVTQKFSGSWANASSLLILLFGVSIIFIGATKALGGR